MIPGIVVGHLVLQAGLHWPSQPPLPHPLQSTWHELPAYLHCTKQHCCREPLDAGVLLVRNCPLAALDTLVQAARQPHPVAHASQLIFAPGMGGSVSGPYSGAHFSVQVAPL